VGGRRGKLLQATNCHRERGEAIHHPNTQNAFRSDADIAVTHEKMIVLDRNRCEPTARANARPMTDFAKQSMSPHKERKLDCFASLANDGEESHPHPDLRLLVF
jgi:hypothetical protein